MKPLILAMTLTSLALSFTASGMTSDTDRLAGLYKREPTLQETMLATRAKYTAWVAEQTLARAAVTCGPWFVAEGEGASPEKGVDLTAKDKAGKPLWNKRPAWKDGTLIPAGGDNPAQKSVLLCRTLTAKKAVTLTAGFGGGDKMEVWLNGKHVASQDTHLDYKRYGTGIRLEGDRRNQFLLNLPLTVGENCLAVRLQQEQVELRSYMRPELLRLFFSPLPDPVPRFWEQLRKDFPPASNRLLEMVNVNWFQPGGWFDCPKDAQFEKELLASVSAAPDMPATLEQCVAAVDLAVARADIAKLRLAVAELGRSFPKDYPATDFLRRLDDYEHRLNSRTARATLTELDRCRRLMLVDANPLLRGATLLVTKRYTYDSQHYYDDYYHGPTEWGGNICEVSLADGRVRDIVPQLAGGIFDRYDLSTDARRIIFGYRAAKPTGYRIYEAGIDGSGLRQITTPPADEDERVAKYAMYSPDQLKQNPTLYGHWTDDMHPCYLPDGDIVFVSSRCERSVLCGGHSLTTTSLHRMNADGKDMRQLSQGALSEFTPTMLEDGRILYNRWEYVYKGIAAIQPLWTMRPDGSGSEEVYGDNIANPGAFVQGRQIPGRPDLVVCTGCGHEPLAVGAIVLLDLHKDKRTPAVMTSLTPNVETRGLRGLYQFRNGQWKEDVFGPFYCDPYPLSDKFFLVSCNPDKRYNDQKAYGVYLLDTFGNRVEVYRDPEISCWQPMLLKARPQPPVVASAPSTGMMNAAKEATLVVADVHKGLDGVKPGTVKWLRVMEQIPRPWSVQCDAKPGDSFPGQMVAVSYYTHIWIAVLHGIVPVHEDGSAYFTVPADKSIYLQALDENFMEVQKMRTFVNLKPGENRSCIGCHEHRIQSPQPKRLAALCQPPVKPVPQPGETAPRPIHYASDVQPTLDKHCVRCHSGSEPGAKLNLTSEMTEHFNRSYEELIAKGMVNFIQEWTGPRMKDPPPYFTVGGSMAHAPAVPPYTYGSHQSKLVDVLRKGHHDVKLSREEFIKLVTWVDANAPFYGSYFGRRNIRYQKRPDFRPVPTLASACGVMPEPMRPPHISAQLLAWWRFEEDKGERTLDASGNKHDARIVHASRTPDAKLGETLKFDGNGYVEAGGLGAHETLSVALWVKLGETKNTWNPLLFTSTARQSAFHFSLLRDGTPNVAINVGGTSWIHRRAKRPLAVGQWHHLAVVCDSRPGGNIQFYVDGRKDTDISLDTNVPLDLAAFRLGAWSLWERSPNNNFHGALGNVRIYSGLLGDREVADLAKGVSLRTAATIPNKPKQNE
ncbi:MAG: LamG-like jellyroll fold domain-containing protein [Verrucomicrobiia bacterium]